ncbi:MBL fold metallo-hydrolase [Thermoflavimicrobium dichotomicum]|uniref:Glyoxylase, beta-lactamase superfamily II n=1 Tax=Thermoflavimicrobium dichotomicum TaxID=46223 RepID=A0A1I3TCN0_9BACL|nr:MBL fold metallo-hydrolase [Thermoflavimicrobium dichotomicum]SFJ67247.1 Glyoxylase, beta-lactamase superfamily II [Thermoflavimicrobium dichotomicum]
MQIANGVEMLEISANIMGKLDTIFPTLIWDKDTVILVDTGYPGQLPKFREAMEKAGVPFEKLSKIIITHQDLDHIGSLPVILKESPHRVEVLASELEKPFIQGERGLLKITPEAIAQAMDSLPVDVPEEWRKAFKAVLENPPSANVDKTVADGEELPYCGGITVIHTPGHTPGHICLYHKPSKTLIAGDAMRVKDGQLLGPDPQATLDMDTAIKSLKKLTQYDIETVICYHGGLYKGNANRRIAELANG